METSRATENFTGPPMECDVALKPGPGSPHGAKFQAAYRLPQEWRPAKIGEHLWAAVIINLTGDAWAKRIAKTELN
jgi:hypothetical protein